MGDSLLLPSLFTSHWLSRERERRDHWGEFIYSVEFWPIMKCFPPKILEGVLYETPLCLPSLRGLHPCRSYYNNVNM